MFLLKTWLFVLFLNYSCLAQTSAIRKDVSLDLELKLNKSLEKERHGCKVDIDILKSAMNDQSNQIAYLFNVIAAMGNNTVQQTNGNRTSPESYQHTAVLERREIQPRQVVTRIAFSVYLNQNLNNLGPDQTIIYRGILLNDGNAYNQYSGIFTVPVTGTYVFTASAEHYLDKMIWLKIVKNNVLQTSIKVHPYASRNSQGSNTVIIRCTQGENVWVAVDSNHYGESLEGSSTLRTNTFSGFLLYQ